MSYEPDVHHRRSIRLRDFDYTSAGAYFVTLCLQNSACLLGDIVDGDMILNDAGRMIEVVWRALPERFQVAQLDEFRVMPNHLHGILILHDRRGEPCVRPVSSTNTDGHGKHESQGEHKVRPYGTEENSLGRVIQAFKSLTTRAYVTVVNNRTWPPFSGKLWQRNYYERVIRNDDELTRARDYMLTNPMKWGLDKNNPAYNP